MNDPGIHPRPLVVPDDFAVLIVYALNGVMNEAVPDCLGLCRYSDLRMYLLHHIEDAEVELLGEQFDDRAKQIRFWNHALFLRKLHLRRCTLSSRCWNIRVVASKPWTYRG